MEKIQSVTNTAMIMDDELNMKVFLYTVSVVMIVAWALGYFVYSYDSNIHLLLVCALILGAIGIYKEN